MIYVLFVVALAFTVLGVGMATYSEERGLGSSQVAGFWVIAAGIAIALIAAAEAVA